MKPFVVLIGGSYSGCGKTTFGTRLLRALGKDWAVIKYTKTGFYSTIVNNKDILSVEGKDTKKYLEAGAGEVLWVQCPLEALSELLSMSLERLSNYKGIIIEGNSPIEFLKPDVVIFLNGLERPPKESAIKVKERADIIVRPDKMEEALEETEELINKKKLLSRELQKRAINNRISCAIARQIAETLGLQYREVGEMADALGIKITNCELGCF